MDISVERSDAIIGTLFQTIINDMKNSSPLWEDFIAKATKLHACLRAAIQALASYLEAFQKIADAATNSKGATKEIGTALTRVCLRHKAVETRMKTFTTAFMDCLIIPLQDRLEDWRKQVTVIDKDHAKEYKRCRTELKKRSSDTLRLQKKAKKGQTDNLHMLVESSMQDVNLRRNELEEVERKSLRAVMVEERNRYCTFVKFLQPVVHHECEVMSELGHLQEAMQLIAVVTKDPSILPQASEELILESKTNLSLYPDSPGPGSQACSNSLGSRKSSVCSISSMNSSSSGSPGHQFQRSLSQYTPAIRLKPGESSDSGFCSSPALTSQASTATSQSHVVSTWPPSCQDGMSTADRPHTISSAYEKGHQRPALTVYTFQNPDTIMENQKPTAPNMSCRPPLPVRCSSLERPLSSGPPVIAAAPTAIKPSNTNSPRQCPSPIPAHIAKEYTPVQPTYVNMAELASMAASKSTNNNNINSNINNNVQQAPPTTLSSYQTLQQPNSPALSSASSLISPDSTATNPISSPDVASGSSLQTPQNTPMTSTPQTPIVSIASSILGDGDNDNDKTLSSSSTINNDFNSDNNREESNENNTANNPFEFKQSSIDSDIIKCTASVLEKTSMFEKLEQQQVNNNVAVAVTPTRVESIYGRKNEEIYRSTGLLSEKDPDQIDKQTIEELNNLIGELDLFQKEHESAMLMEKQRHHSMSTKEDHNQINNNVYSSNNSDTVSSLSDRNDKISISSLSNFESLNLSINSANMSDGSKFNYSDTDITKYNCIDETLDTTDYILKTGFENPSFNHLNDSDIMVMRETDYHADFYSQSMSEVVVLRCKDHVSNTTLNSEDSSTISGQFDGSQRLSSFKNEGMKLGNSRSASPALSITTFSPKPLTPSHIPITEVSIIEKKNMLNSMPSDERLNRIKPAVQPRPASLSGAARVTRRASINTVKPPPPVRRSSSVTPSHNLGTNSPNLSQQSIYTSSENLPPPPAYLLDTPANNTNSNVAETVKALNEIRHQPASPVMRRAHQQQHTYQQQVNTNQYSSTFSTPKSDTSMSSIYSQSPNSFNTSNDSFNMSSSRTPKSSHQQGIYAQPKQISSNMSSFRTSSPGPQKSTGFLSQLNARLVPNKSQQSQQQHSSPSQNESIYQKSNNFVDQRQYGNQPQMYASSPQHHQTQSPPHYQAQPPKDGKNQIYHTNIPTYQHQQYHQQYYQQQNQIYSNYNPIYVSTNPFITHPSATANYSPSSFGKSDSTPSSGQYGSNHQSKSNVLAKTSAGFLENLNARLAEQRLSNKAFAVRNLINSKAMPDPRICHESLMDQIKRGATLKRNRTINDRSAPKIKF